jgi:dienelactone hydrolase
VAAAVVATGSLLSSGDHPVRAGHQSSAVSAAPAGASPDAHAPTAAQAPAITDPATTPTTIPLLQVPVPVTTTTVQFTDTTRPVVRSGVTITPYRYLPTVVWRPVGPGPWPLVVFVHGYNVGPMTYQRFCSTLAAHGYVVAAPSFPLEDPSRGNGLDRADLPNEATDVSFVITQLESGALKAVIDPSRVAVAGHSDGADVALMVGYQAGKVDPRVKAVVSYAPDPMAAASAEYATPLLLIQGSADEVVPYSASQTVFGQVNAPRWYLTLVGAGHLPPIAGGTAWTSTLDSDVAAFLDSTLHRPVQGEQGLPEALTGSSLTRLRTSP